MKVLYYTAYPPGAFATGGAALAIWYAADALASREEVELVICCVGEIPDAVHERFKDRAALKEMSDPGELPGLIDEAEPDLFHGMLPSAASAIDYCKQKGIPTIYEVRSAKCYPCRFIHKLRPPYHRQWREMLKGREDRKLARRADFVLVPSQSALENLQRFYGVEPKKSLGFYNGVDHEIFHPGGRGYASAGELLIVNAGRVTRDRNFDEVVRAFEILRREMPHQRMRLLLAGKGPDRERVEGLIEERAIADVEFLGAVPPNELARLFRSADLLLNASESESFGNVVAEAMACGLPVVCYRAGSLPELVMDGETGFLADVHDVQGLTSHAAKVLGSEELRSRMGHRAVETVLSKFSWKGRAEKVAELYARLG